MTKVSEEGLLMAYGATEPQAGSSLTLFTERNVDRINFGWEFPKLY